MSQTCMTTDLYSSMSSARCFDCFSQPCFLIPLVFLHVIFAFLPHSPSFLSFPPFSPPSLLPFLLSLPFFLRIRKWPRENNSQRINQGRERERERDEQKRSFLLFVGTLSRFLCFSISCSFKTLSTPSKKNNNDKRKHDRECKRLREMRRSKEN